jgi:hypothetical protein
MIVEDEAFESEMKAAHLQQKLPRMPGQQQFGGAPG